MVAGKIQLHLYGGTKKYIANLGWDYKMMSMKHKKALGCITFLKDNYLDIKEGKESDYMTGHCDSNSLITTNLIYNGLGGRKR